MKKEKAAASSSSSPLSLANYFDGLLLSKFLFPSTTSTTAAFCHASVAD